LFLLHLRYQKQNRLFRSFGINLAILIKLLINVQFITSSSERMRLKIWHSNVASSFCLKKMLKAQKPMTSISKERIVSLQTAQIQQTIVDFGTNAIEKQVTRQR
jgi:hypothetical protein